MSEVKLKWMPVGVDPINRENHDGLLPCPGDEGDVMDLVRSGGRSIRELLEDEDAELDPESEDF